ncbi:signal peptide peptidase SppA [Rickettsiales bacterium]|nr:signal peptide peptidase SppA [Rickettsiales bacterium]
MVTKNKLALFDLEFYKKKLFIWRLVTIFTLIALIFVTFKFDNINADKSDYIARVSINGFIDNDQFRIEKLDSIAKDKFAKALIIDIDSPGGSVVGGELLFKKIKEISVSIPTVVFIGSQATSAAYLAAIGANYIVSPQGSLVGSVGVILQSFDITEFAKSIGIEPIIIKSSVLKGVPHVAEKLTPEAKASLEEVIDDIYIMFKDFVLESRTINDEYVVEALSGRVFSGNKAFDMGLVDKVGDFQDVRDYLTNQNVSNKLQIKEITLKKDDVSSLFKIIAPVFDMFLNSLYTISAN